MSLPVVPPTLFHAQALAADPNDPHLQPGIHLRVAANPRLGLPIAPFAVWRATTVGLKGLAVREDAVFIDSRGRAVTAPFALRPDNPVTAYLPLAPGEVCLWANVRAEPHDRPPRGGITATADTNGAHGPTPVGRRREPAYSFSAPGLVRIHLAGTGTVVGVVWLEQADVGRAKLKWIPWTALNLPHVGGARYLTIDDALGRADARVGDQAPKRRPLQETVGAVPPLAAPLETPAYESGRVASLTGPLGAPLDRLVTDTSAPALDLVDQDDIRDDRNEVIGQATQRCIDRVLQGLFDPGTAAWLGYKALDREFPDPQPLLVFYWVSGLFRDLVPAPDIARSDPVFDAQLAVLGGESRVGTAAQAFSAFRRLVRGLDVEADGDELERARDYIGLGALAVADRGAVLDPIDAPVIDATDHVGWLPVVPPAARREVHVAVSGVVAGGLLAGERQTPDGGAGRVQLNVANRDGYHLPLVLSLNRDATGLAPAGRPGTGFVADRDATDVTVRYWLSQQDGFGRWSQWVSATSPPGDRPRPPRPVIRAVYTQPADPSDDGGTVRVLVAVPALETLASGARPLAALELTAEDRTTGSTTGHTGAITDPLAPPAQIEVEFEGPLLAPTEARQLRLVARWRDTAGTTGESSEPQTLTMHDPRPPVQVSVPDQLQYSARPDVAGLALVEHTWTRTPDQHHFAVYYSDENRLVGALAAAAPGTPGAALRDELDDTADPAARAGLFRAHASLFPTGLFERLDTAVSTTATGQPTFRHSLSGSLRILSFYRIAAESATSARVDVADLPLLVFAVPNSDPPAQPVLTVVPDPMADNGAAYTVTACVSLLPAATRAITWRLRRSTLGATDVARMPVVATGPMDGVDADGRQVATFQDLGPVQIATDAALQPWVRYTWVVETQGDVAPGSAVSGRPIPGLWSAPSNPVSVMLVPPQPPEPATGLTATGTATGGGNFVAVALSFDHPHTLSGGVAGAYMARVARRAPGASLTVVAEVALTDGGVGPYVVSGMRPDDPADEVPADTTYQIVLIDPLGRESTAVETTLG